MARVTVIVPCYNAEKTVERAIRSILRQSDPDFEIVAVDDGSSDRTAEVLASIDDPRLHVVAHETNAGISAARNTGLAAADGEFLAFLDSDDEWESDFLARVHAARGSADAVVCGRTVVLPDGSTRTARSARQGTLTGEQAALGMMTGAVTPFPWDKVIRRTAFEDIRYPIDVHRFEDQVVGIIALSRVPVVVCIPDPLVRYHVAAGSLTWGRMPAVAEADSALAFLATGLGSWLEAPAHRRAWDVCQTLFLMLTAQSAMRSDDAGAALVLEECRQRITARMVRSTLRSNPVFGAGALLLRLAPRIYHRIFHVYVRRQYALS